MASAPAPAPTAPLDDPFAFHLTAPIQRHADGGEVSAAPSASGGGSPLGGPVRNQMESAFGQDFSAVRVHEGPQAASVGALAYTQGTDIHFRPGLYDPGSRAGQELLGHELAHVVQQSQGRVAATAQAKGVALNDDVALEREADEWGARAAAHQPTGSPTGGAGASPSSSSPIQAKSAVIQRAVGFEFEAFNWDLKDAEGKPVPKATPLIRRQGGLYNLEGEDKKGGSTVEFVAKPLETRDQVIQVIGDAQSLAQKLVNAHGKVDLAQHGAAESYILDTTADTTFGLQVSPSVPLDRIRAMAERLEERRVTVGGASLTSVVDGVDSVLRPRDLRKTGKNAETAVSPELEGLLILVVDLIRRAGQSMGMMQFPKQQMSIMARTTFTKMFSMVPEADYYRAHLDEWVDLVMRCVRATEGSEQHQSDTHLFNQAGFQTLPERKGHEQEDHGKTMKLTTTRDEWLRAMPDEDLLSNRKDARIEGMGAYGDITDKLAEPTIRQGSQLLEKYVEESEDEEAEESEESEEDKREVVEGLGRQRLPPPPEKYTHAPSTAKRAPLFELRQVGGALGEPRDFLPKALNIFDAIDEALGGANYQMDKSLDRQFLEDEPRYEGAFQEVQQQQPPQQQQLPQQQQPPHNGGWRNKFKFKKPGNPLKSLKTGFEFLRKKFSN